MRLAGVGDVLERLVVAAQRLSPLLRCLRRHDVVLQTVEEQDGRANVGHLVDGGCGAIGGPVVARVAEHHLRVQPRRPLTLRPRRVDVGVAVLADATGKQVIRVAGHAAGDHVAAVAAAQDADARRVNALRVQEARPVEHVLRVAHAPGVVVGVLESAAVARAAAEVGRQEGVALGQEVLRQAVPLVQMVVGRAAVGADDGRAVGLGRLPQKRRNVQPVVAAITDGLRCHEIERVERRQSGEGQLRHRPAMSVHTVEVGGLRRVLILNRQEAAIG